MRYLGLFIILFSHAAAFAAVPPRLFYAERLKTTADTDTIIRKRSLSVGVSYGNDAIFFGRVGPVKYPFVTTDVVYNDKSGLFIYGSGLKVLGYDPVFDEVDVGGGYFYKFSKKFSGAISYTRFIFNNDAKIIKSASSNDINFKNSFDWKVTKSSVVMDFLFGKSNDFFVTFSQSKLIEPSWSIFTDDDYLTINPSANVIFGTQNFVNTYTEDRDIRKMGDYIYSARMDRNNRRFTVLNYYFKVPVAYNMPHFTLEASYRYSIPVNVENVLQNKHASFFNLTFYYLFY
ncbi:hypothetical protein EOD41_12275 [Mucilaginibacter limnophilus]|uniref:MipA/OmpV family protein n=1 Tax=Mucilaginibacter limnophilus TaxID=1932778 RepID=A0A437MRL8_9SPHI|nr:hypothetical protein [Mucilaginibacter limnophilus]RVU00254.1 hypothetical protein EOD41_12275 [Mucilaginibacter limnophilus]